jgi:hypothetical protein
LASSAIPFLPLTTALREWAARGAEVPALGAETVGPAGGAVVVFDVWLDRVCERQPAVVVVDDL